MKSSDQIVGLFSHQLKLINYHTFLPPIKNGNFQAKYWLKRKKPSLFYFQPYLCSVLTVFILIKSYSEREYYLMYINTIFNLY